MEGEDDREWRTDLLLTITLISFGCFKLSTPQQPNLLPLAIDMLHSHMTVGFNGNDTQQEH